MTKTKDPKLKRKAIWPPPELQAILFFICCLICSCCSISSYLLGSASPRHASPTPLRVSKPMQAATRALATIDTEAHTPVSTPTKPPTSTGTPHLTETILPPSPTQTPAPTTASWLPTPTPTHTPTRTPKSTPTPTTTPTMTLTPTSTIQATSTPTITLTPTLTPTPIPCPEELDCEGVCILDVLYDPEEDGENPLDEYADIVNNGASDQDMAGWTLCDELNHCYTFPDFTLGSNDMVTVWTKTKSDTDPEEDLYWGLDEPVWDNDGDTAYLKDDEGTLVHCWNWIEE